MEVTKKDKKEESEGRNKDKKEESEGRNKNKRTFISPRLIF